MEDPRFVVIDPDDRVIVMLAHGISPFLAIDLNQEINSRQRDKTHEGPMLWKTLAT
jgi:hypothetical protein